MIISLFGMVVLRQLFLAIVMRHPRIEYIYAAFPLGWGLTAFMLMVYYFAVRGQIRKKMAAAEAGVIKQDQKEGGLMIVAG